MEENVFNNEEVLQLASQEEPRFLSIMLRDKDCLMDAVAFGIKPGVDGHFFGKKTRKLYGFIHQYYKKHGAVLTRTALDSVVQGLDIDEASRGALMMVWDKSYNINCSTEDYDLLKNNINNRYVQKQAISIIHNVSKDLIHAKSNQNEVVESIQDEFNAIDGIHADSYALTLPFDEGIRLAMDHIEERREHPDKDPGVLTGIKAIDDMYLGFPRGDYLVISGMVNGGKTTLMFNMGFNMAKAGYNVAYVSLEKKAVPVVERLMCLHSMVDYNRIRRGGKGEYGLTDYYYNKLREASEDLLNNIKPNLHVLQMVQDTKLSKILSEIDKVHARNKLDVIIVDYLGVIGAETFTQGRPDLDLAKTSIRLQAYCRNKDALGITGVQITNEATRGVRKTVQKAEEDASAISVNTEDLGGSQRVIADADHGISIVLNGDSPPTKAFAHSTKSRETESKVTVVLDFDGRIGRISDPVLEPGQVKEVDDIIYNDEVVEAALETDDDLFVIGDDQNSEKPEKVKEENNLGDLYEETPEVIEREPVANQKGDVDDWLNS